jgi:predicted DNA-binding transcriptional regulator YafY
MSYKFDSLITILKKLDEGETVTVHSLMNDLEVRERSVYRYMQTLQTAGFPISYDRKKQSYVFSNNYSLGKPNLTLEETLALALSKNFLKNFGEMMEKSIDTIQKKLSVKKAEIPKHIILGLESIPPTVGSYIETINRAISEYKRIEITYKALYSNKEITRKVDPYYLFFRDGFWHLRGYCHFREDFRTFVLDRIITLRSLDEHFLPKNISPEEELASSFGTFIDGEEAEVILRFDPPIKQYVLRKKWHQTQETTELGNGQLEIRFRVNGIKGIKNWIYQWIPYVHVIAPPELRKLVKMEIDKAAKNFK